MRPVPYIGISGLMLFEESFEILQRFPKKAPRKFAIGVLASSKTLRGETNRLPNRFPHVGCIHNIFISDTRVLNLVHLATDNIENLDMEISKLEVLTQKNILDGFQLNIKWPDPTIVRKSIPQKNYTVILQVGHRALDEIKNDPTECVKRLKDYGETITHVLIDPSGGYGKKLDIQMANLFIQEISNAFPNLGIGIAGGFCAEDLWSLAELVQKYPFINIDAEGNLRTSMPEDKLDLARAHAYVKRAHELFS